MNCVVPSDSLIRPKATSAVINPVSRNTSLNEKLKRHKTSLLSK